MRSLNTSVSKSSVNQRNTSIPRIGNLSIFNVIRQEIHCIIFPLNILQIWASWHMQCPMDTGLWSHISHERKTYHDIKAIKIRRKSMPSLSRAWDQRYSFILQSTEQKAQLLDQAASSWKIDIHVFGKENMHDFSNGEYFHSEFWTLLEKKTSINEACLGHEPSEACVLDKMKHSNFWRRAFYAQRHLE